MQESTAPLGANLGIPLTTPAGSALVSRTPSADPPNRTNPSTDSAEAAATRKAIRVMIATQKASIIQSQTDREATPESGRVDLQKFKTSDGPFHAIKPFLNWVKALEIFFLTKGILHDTDKITIVGSLIRETNTLAFYASKAETLGTFTWLGFKELLFGFALPPLWHTTLKLKLRELQMRDSESFLTFSTRGRTLMSLYNFDAPSPMTEWELAKAAR
ncbi:hypothetical protein PCASD_02724 [Puccinia coronata f. sp. avenae]|uniref:Retrotransposon gag domain-containing protein n=1 Tax=Puccinia coronata f. sp. avenae TaxID=200324 RepID=A0A2N5VH48_9BASI|nr:hypothetical protein PCASD_02724 [Puccinia coronata f. sp. avenae]